MWYRCPLPRQTAGTMLRCRLLQFEESPYATARRFFPFSFANLPNLHFFAAPAGTISPGKLLLLVADTTNKGVHPLLFTSILSWVYIKIYTCAHCITRIRHLASVSRRSFVKRLKNLVFCRFLSFSKQTQRFLPYSPFLGSKPPCHSGAKP